MASNNKKRGRKELLLRLKTLALAEEEVASRGCCFYSIQEPKREGYPTEIY